MRLSGGLLAQHESWLLPEQVTGEQEQGVLLQHTPMHPPYPRGHELEVTSDSSLTVIPTYIRITDPIWLTSTAPLMSATGAGCRQRELSLMCKSDPVTGPRTGSHHPENKVHGFQGQPTSLASVLWSPLQPLSSPLPTLHFSLGLKLHVMPLGKHF